MIGLSVSFCIRDIAEGLVEPADVKLIVAGTCAPDDVAFKRVVDGYLGSYWYDHVPYGKTPSPNFNLFSRSKAAEQLAWEFWHAGKIVQPRCLRTSLMFADQVAPNIAAGHWLIWSNFYGRYIQTKDPKPYTALEATTCR